MENGLTLQSIAHPETGAKIDGRTVLRRGIETVEIDIEARPDGLYWVDNDGVAHKCKGLRIDGR